MTNQAIITKFYTAFANHDAQGMQSCYAEDVLFEDPAFGQLKGNKVGYMWQMLLEQSKGDLKVTFDKITDNTAEWKAVYKYNNRPVTNHIKATFIIENGLIIQHTDSFNLWKWTQQALGAPGYLLGWTGFLRNQIQKQTNKALKKYIEVI